jgi:hypothetical protein
MFDKLLKAAVAVTLSPVAVAVDIVRLPFTAEDPKGKPFGCTETLLKSAADNVKDAVK